MANLLHKVPADMKLKNQTDGFTLIELMIVIVIIAALAAVAIVAYTRHIKSSRLTAERNFCASIVALQETYFQRWGQYHDTSGGVNSLGAFYPTKPGAKFEDAPWKPGVAGDNKPLWVELGAQPEGNITYFMWRVEASMPKVHALYGKALFYGVPAQPPAGTTPHAWFYIEGIASMDGSTTKDTIIYASSGRSSPITLNEGQ